MRVFAALASAEIQADIAISNMQAHVDWLKTGAVPGKPKLRVVANQGAAS
jgi:hypothetical protein